MESIVLKQNHFRLWHESFKIHRKSIKIYLNVTSISGLWFTFANKNISIMKHLKFKSVIVVMLVSFLGFTACKNDKKQTKENASSEQVDQQSEEQTSSPEATSEEDTDQSASSEDKNIAELTIDGSDKMQYDKKELKVKAGQTVKLTLTHSGSMPKSAMGHNFVLLKNGVDPADFAKAAWKAKDNDYI